MSDNSVVLPQTTSTPGAIVTGGGHGHGYHRDRGLEGKDAAFFIQNALRDLTRDVADSKAEAIEARLAGQIKSLECQVAILSEIKENRHFMALDKAERKEELCELKMLILDKSKSVEDLLKEQEMRSLRAQLAACQAAAACGGSAK